MSSHDGATDASPGSGSEGSRPGGLRVDVFTIFGPMVTGFAAHSLLGKAREAGLIDLRVHDIREHTSDVHRTVDDSPFGGGAGMVMKPEPIFSSVEAVDPPRPIIALGPAGARFDQARAAELAVAGGFSLLCGRYEGIDQRVHDHLVDEEISIGDYVLNGGEVAAMAVLEAVVRLVPGVIGNSASAEDESFSDGLLEYPHFTRPAEYRGWVIPEVLRSGDHARVQRWRRAMSLRRTMRRRPDLIDAMGGLDAGDLALLEEFPEEPDLPRE